MASDQFPITTAPEYFIKELHLSANPDIDRTKMGMVSPSFEPSNPSVDHEQLRFVCDCVLELQLYTQEADIGSDNYNQVEFGKIEIKFKIVVEPHIHEGKEIEEDWVEKVSNQVEIWTEEGYSHTANEFQFQIESEILSEVIVPVSNLLNNSFKGIVPRVSFE